MMRRTILAASLASGLLLMATASQGQDSLEPEPEMPTSALRRTTGGTALSSLPSQHRSTFSGNEKRLFGDTHTWMKKRGLLASLDLALLDQYASRVGMGRNNAGTFAWQLFMDYEIIEWKGVGSLHISGTGLGSVGLDYDQSNNSLSARTGSVSILNANVYPDRAALDELYLQYLSPNAAFFFSIGKIDMSDFFDNNRVANNAFDQFLSFTFQNSLSIPYPTYGDVGILTQWSITDDLYVMFGAGIAQSEERVPVWSGISGEWWELLESGITVRPAALGTGTYRITIWQSNVSNAHWVGVSLSIDQELGREWLVGFLRMGRGNPDQTSISSAIAGGISIQQPFGRRDDQVGFAFSWADSVASSQDEKLFEIYYRYSLGGSLSLSPDLQFLIDPSGQPEISLSVIGGFRIFYEL